VFNGTIYNYQSLRQDLIKRGYRFFSTADTEVILKAYHLWGEDCVLHLARRAIFCLIISKSCDLTAWLSNLN
jgi:asparagine synthase (glutamine-hydrolysing)